MSLALEAVTTTSEFIAPRDLPVTPFSCWERGGTALDDVSDGLDVQSWFFECDPDTGIVSVSVPDVIVAVAVYTISPLPVQMTASFDLDMHPALAWVDVNGDAFRRIADVNTALPARTRDVKLALDDVRPEQLENITDLILAYTRDNVLYCRQLRESFAVETTLAASGFSSLYQIGMNVDFRFQFQRSASFSNEDATLSYLDEDNRASKLVGFDADGNASLYDVVLTGTVGADGPTIYSTKLQTNHTIFLRNDADDGQWASTTASMKVSFYRGTALRAALQLDYAVDTYGRITRTSSGTQGEGALRIVELGAGTLTYTATVYLPETGQGVTFNILSASNMPVIGTFEPAWNTNGDFAGGSFVPTGTVRFFDFGAYVTLTAAEPVDETYASRSTSTRLRWGAGSLPAAQRPTAAREVECLVSRSGVTVAGRAQLETDGSVEFWPVDATGARTVFQATVGSTLTEKGLPTGFVLTYVKISGEPI